MDLVAHQRVNEDVSLWEGRILAPVTFVLQIWFLLSIFDILLSECSKGLSQQLEAYI